MPTRKVGQVRPNTPQDCVSSLSRGKSLVVVLTSDLNTAYEREGCFALLLGNKPVILNEVKHALRHEGNLSWA